MSDFIELVRDLLHAGDVRISEHGYDEPAEDGLTAREVLAGVQDAVVVEEYLNYPKGHVSYSCIRIERANPSMLYGAFRKDMINLLF